MTIQVPQVVLNLITLLLGLGKAHTLLVPQDHHKEEAPTPLVELAVVVQKVVLPVQEVEAER